MHGALGRGPNSGQSMFDKLKLLGLQNFLILLCIRGDCKSFAKAVHCRGGGFFGRRLGAGGRGAWSSQSSQKRNRSRIQTSSTCERGGRVSV
jgi:hypothetical protein